VSSRSARVSSERPFYDLHAEAYDELITDPVEPWVQEVHGHLRNAGLDRASVLDAGCGTGRHAAALIKRGHRVDLLDASERLLAIARRRCPGSRAYRIDICAPNVAGQVHGQFEAITCRGVLNDLVLDAERDAALESFAALCADGGLLFLDVREAAAARQRADGRLRHVEVELEDGATLRFTSRPLWSANCVLVQERYELRLRDGTTSAHDYLFRMRPWEPGEIQAGLVASGFSRVRILPGVGRRTPDRLFVVARRAR
jgi:SAM-dependent methyltransferase